MPETEKNMPAAPTSPPSESERQLAATHLQAGAQIQTPPDPYALLQPGGMTSMLELLADNLGSNEVSMLDLPRFQVPTGGGLLWVLKELEGEETAKEIEGVIVAWRSSRLYWKKAFGEGGGRKPPDCISRNGFEGTGDPGGICADCPMAQFGSASKGHGQACKQIRQLLVIRPGEIIPHLVSVPPTSLKAVSQYFLALSARQIPYWGVVSKLRLERTQNEDGIAYAKIVFAAGRVFTPREQQTLKTYHLRMQQILTPLTLDARDYVIEGEEAPAAAPPAPANSDEVPF